MKPTIFAELKELIRNPLPKYQFKPVDNTPRALVYAWLDSIGATNDEIAEVIEQCENDKEARAFYLEKARGKL